MDVPVKPVKAGTKMKTGDAVKHPQHYTSKGIEPITYINSHNFNFNLGNVVKYITRAGMKEGNSYIQDLKKAAQYLEFEIQRVETSAWDEEDDV